MWPETVREKFERFVKQGGVFVLQLWQQSLWRMESDTHQGLRPRDRAKNITVLTWAEALAMHGRWPVEWTISYSMGRVYTSTMGHVQGACLER